MAARLYAAGLDIAPAVGTAAMHEFEAFLSLLGGVPDLEQILDGNGDALIFPTEPSLGYATVTGLTLRAQTAPRAHQALRWLAAKAEPEWAQLFTTDTLSLLRRTDDGALAALQRLIAGDAELGRFLADVATLSQ